MGTYNNFYKINSVDLIDIFYPVGTIYQTENANFDPQTVWGGTWARIEDKFLVASGEVYTSTGGSASASVTLTTDNLPSHNHGFTPSGSVESTFTGSEVTSGAGSAHSHTRGSMNITGTMTGRNIVRDGSWSGALYNTGSSYYCDGGAGSKSGGVGLNASDNWSGSTSSESSHTHSVTAAGSVSSSFTGTSGNTDSAGSGVAFSVPTIPPYQAVYVWKRTA